MDDEDVWFEPKRFGYGSGLPVRWQGWALLAGYLTIVTAAALLLPRYWPLYVVVPVAATGVLLVLCARHTRGGWRWRNGGE